MSSIGITPDELTERFTEGLKKYNLTPEEILASGWRYCGGSDEQKDITYWKKDFDKRPFLTHKDKCVCGHKIVINKYICNRAETEFLVLGSCCIKRFTNYGCRRTCSRCEKPHQNRSDNYCHDCRKINEKELLERQAREIKKQQREAVKQKRIKEIWAKNDLEQKQQTEAAKRKVEEANRKASYDLKLVESRRKAQLQSDILKSRKEQFQEERINNQSCCDARFVCNCKKGHYICKRCGLEHTDGTYYCKVVIVMN
jgi:hypothetical protein